VGFIPPPPDPPEWCRHGVLIHDVLDKGVKIWKIVHPVYAVGQGLSSFEVADLDTGICRPRQRHWHHDPLPAGWRVVSDMEVLALRGMPDEEYRAWAKDWKREWRRGNRTKE
jgi:hypothetical protein